jgi:hypothetical protein
MITRNDYMNNCSSDNHFDSFREYYSQFVTPEIKALVERTFTKEKLVKAYKTDEHFNNIPMYKWDALAGLYPNKKFAKMPEYGCSLSLNQWLDTGGNGPLKSLVNKALLKEAKEGWSLCTATCIAKEAARQIATE